MISVQNVWPMLSTAADGVEIFELIVGTGADDSLEGTGHNDKIEGLGGNDTLDGMAGDDNLKGGDGDDSLLGGNGSNSLSGGRGDDTLVGVGHADVIHGDGGRDFIDVTSHLDSQVFGDGGEDTIRADANFKGLSIGSLNGGAGDDFIQVQTGSGHWRAFGEEGDDRLSDLQSAGSYFSGGDGDDTLSGGSGDDTLLGGADNDLLYGGNGDNLLSGDDGDDALYLSQGATTFDGGSGLDTIDARLALEKPVLIDLANGVASGAHVGNAEFTSVENAIGGNAGDHLIGNEMANHIQGLAGRDLLDGGAGDDRLEGGTFADILIGGLGADRLDGDEGADTFRFDGVADSPVGGVDLILKLQIADVVDLSAIDADTTTDGDQAFALVDHFTGAAGQLHLRYDAGSDLTLIEGDTDGDGVAELTISARHDHHEFASFRL